MKKLIVALMLCIPLVGCDTLAKLRPVQKINNVVCVPDNKLLDVGVIIDPSEADLASQEAFALYITDVLGPYVIDLRDKLVTIKDFYESCKKQYEKKEEAK